jgi:hypothetical protein
MTERPIENATVKFDKREYKTDSLGYFEIHYITGFCPDWDFQIEKENYRTENILIILSHYVGHRRHLNSLWYKGF